jgi:hypothetical protein
MQQTTTASTGEPLLRGEPARTLQHVAHGLTPHANYSAERWHNLEITLTALAWEGSNNLGWSDDTLRQIEHARQAAAAHALAYRCSSASKAKTTLKGHL